VLYQPSADRRLGGGLEPDSPSLGMPRARLAVFKSVCGSRYGTAATCLVATAEKLAKQDHPAYIPHFGSLAMSTQTGSE